MMHTIIVILTSIIMALGPGKHRLVLNTVEVADCGSEVVTQYDVIRFNVVRDFDVLYENVTSVSFVVDGDYPYYAVEFQQRNPEFHYCGRTTTTDEFGVTHVTFRFRSVDAQR